MEVMKDRKYHITSMNINSSSSSQQYTCLGSGSSMIQEPIRDLVINCDIFITDPMVNLQSLEQFEEFLSLRPTWCTDKMMTKALKAMYPEEYL